MDCAIISINSIAHYNHSMIKSSRGVFDVYCWHEYHIGKRLGNVVRYGKVDGPVSPQ